MNREQWLSVIAEAYKAYNIPLTDNVKKQLLSVEEIDEAKNYPGGKEAWRKSEKAQINFQAQEIIQKYFWMKAVKGDTFGSLSRVKEKFGASLEVNYDLNEGPFINLAKTYWTYNIELLDLTNSFKGRFAFFLVDLLVVENAIASVFFPITGPAYIPVAQRRQEQIRILKEYAPDMDIDRFIAESPILKADEFREEYQASNSGCFGVVLTILLPVGIIAIMLLRHLW